MKFSIFQESRKGGRRANQDRIGYAYTRDSLLAVVADGMGGHLHGEVAAQITVQEFFAQYAGLAGMTGTAAPSAGEFRRVYHLAVATIPTHRPCLRVQLSDRVLRDARAKWLAIVDEVREMLELGRPVLVGTRSIDKSEALANLLSQAGIAHRVLHARNLAAEAEIVASLPVRAALH